MLPSSPDRLSTPSVPRTFPALPRIAACALLSLSAGIGLFAAGVARAEDEPAAVVAGAEAPVVSTLVERFNVDVSDDGIELTPIGRDSAVESIEILDGEDEALVNGKPFTAKELEAFLGADGKALAEIVALSDRERRVRLGWKEESADEEPVDVTIEIGGLPGIPKPPKPPKAPRAPHVYVHSEGDERVSFGQSIEIDSGETAGEAVCIGCSIKIAGSVDGDAVSVGGRIEIMPGGVVDGNAISVGGRVDVASGGVVNGDAVAVGGRVHVDEGGVVDGQRSSVGWGAGWFGGPTSGFLPFDFSSDFSDFFWTILRAILLALFAAIAVLFARGPVERASRRVDDEPWKALVAGLLTQLLFFPVLILATVILAVSVIGIPLLVLVPVAVLAFFVAMLIGYVAVAQALGRWGKQRFGWTISEPYLVVFVGVLLIQAVTIVARFVSLFGTVAGMIGFALLCLGFFLKYVAWTVGLGGMVLSMKARDWRRPAPASYGPPPAAPLAPIDFDRPDPDEPPADAVSTAMASESAARADERAEATESVDEAELRDRDDRRS
jgi:hypothetical protein